MSFFFFTNMYLSLILIKEYPYFFPLANNAGQDAFSGFGAGYE